jgi:CRISPR system Cascade subunit CasB
VFAVLARPGAGWPSRDLGTALAEASFPESRLSRLLASRGDAFRDQATLVARFLHARDAACTPVDLAELALVEERTESRAERLRFRIARSYYRVVDASPATAVPA